MPSGNLVGNVRCFAPIGGGNHPVMGKTYSAAEGSSVDVPSDHAQTLAANGWTIAANAGVGTTAQRPTNAARGDRYIDTTLNKSILFDGKTWRDPVAGTAV